MKDRKIVIIGNGAVGSTLAYTIMFDSYASEIVIIDINKDKAIGDVMDISQGNSFASTPTEIKVGDYEDTSDAHLIIITAGVGQKVGESRTELLKRNVVVFNAITTELNKYICSEAVVLVVTNPVDVLAYYCRKKLNLPSAQIIGSGTVLDTARLRYNISLETKVDPRNIHTYVLGEHGDSEVAIMSLTTIGGITPLSFCSQCGKCKDPTTSNIMKLKDTIKDAAYEIIKRKGATFYAVAMAVNRIAKAIVLDEKSILTISSLVSHKFEITEIYMSLPCIVGKGGMERQLHLEFVAEEQDKLVTSAKTIEASILMLKE